jgi:NADH dehydrogenase FAD-containing subunit
LLFDPPLAHVRKADKDLYDVTVVSPNSYFSFTPFLASTAVGTLEFRCATEPVRGLKNVKFAQGWANRIGERDSVPILPVGC